MRSPLSYIPGQSPLHRASAPAAIAFLGSFGLAGVLFSNPILLVAAGAGVTVAGLLAGARRAVAASLRLAAGLAFLITVVNGLVTDRGETVLLRLGDWPLLGQVNVTLESLAAGAQLGLRASVAIIAFGVYSACVDPDRVLRLLRPLAGRSALTATLVSRLVPLAASDASRLREAARLRGPGAAPVGRAALARRLLAGSLDRAVDVAATLELRGYGLESGRPDQLRKRTRFDRRLWLGAAAVVLAAVTAKVIGGDGFDAYPTIDMATGPETLLPAVVLVSAGLAPLRPRSRVKARRAMSARIRGSYA